MFRAMHVAKKLVVSMPKFRVLITGGRDYTKEWNVFAALNNLLNIHSEGLVVIEGGASGADRAAREWAQSFQQSQTPDQKSYCVEHLPFKANWKRYGRAAGGIRNGEMLRDGKPHLVVAFPGGQGTRNMITQANQAGVEVIYGEKLACVS